MLKIRFEDNHKILIGPISGHIWYDAMQDGVTPLMYAAKKGHLDVVKVLLQKSADINKTENVCCTHTHACMHTHTHTCIHTHIYNVMAFNSILSGQLLILPWKVDIWRYLITFLSMITKRTR